jgi:5-methylcytosine-specific restriction endonuclease McrA
MLVVDRKHGIKAVASGRALVLDPETWRTFTMDQYQEWPQQFRVIMYPHRKATNEAKLNLGPRGILKRDDHQCQYEGCDHKGTTVDHVIPKCQGGQSTWQNLVACCLECNQKKAGRTPEQAGMKLKHPIRSPRWVLYERFTNMCNNWNKRGE